MNENIKKMIELQAYWDKVMKNRKEIEDSNLKIERLEKELAEHRGIISEIKEKLKTIAGTIKSMELELADKDEKFNKLAERKKIIRTDRELSALNAETEKLRSERDSLEEELIKSFDEQDALKEELSRAEEKSAKSQEKNESDIENLKSKIEKCDSIIREYESKFEAEIENLLPSYRSKFKKLIDSKSGKAVAPVTGDVCGNCNFQIPAYLVSDSAKDDKVVNCTNCGRFIYKDPVL